MPKNVKVESVVTCLRNAPMSSPLFHYGSRMHYAALVWLFSLCQLFLTLIYVDWV